jgi:hypothetical protein
MAPMPLLDDRVAVRREQHVGIAHGAGPVTEAHLRQRLRRLRGGRGRCPTRRRLTRRRLTLRRLRRLRGRRLRRCSHRPSDPAGRQADACRQHHDCRDSPHPHRRSRPTWLRCTLAGTSHRVVVAPRRVAGGPLAVDANTGLHKGRRIRAPRLRRDGRPGARGRVHVPPPLLPSRPSWCPVCVRHQEGQGDRSDPNPGHERATRGEATRGTHEAGRRECDDSVATGRGRVRSRSEGMPRLR